MAQNQFKIVKLIFDNERGLKIDFSQIFRALDVDNQKFSTRKRFRLWLFSVVLVWAVYLHNFNVRSCRVNAKTIANLNTVYEFKLL